MDDVRLVRYTGLHGTCVSLLLRQLWQISVQTNFQRALRCECSATEIAFPSVWLSARLSVRNARILLAPFLYAASELRCYAEFYVWKNPPIRIGGTTLERAVVLKWFYSLSRRKTFVGGKCALPSALLVTDPFTPSDRPGTQPFVKKEHENIWNRFLQRSLCRRLRVRKKLRFSTNILLYLGNDTRYKIQDTRYGHSYMGRRIGTYMRSIELYYF